MRYRYGVLRASLLLLCALGCSRAAPVAPAAKQAAIPSGVYKLIVYTSHELSCSVSFERDNDDATYELTIAPDNSATLVVATRVTRIFGPASAKFAGGNVNKSHKERKLRYVGRANQGATTFEGVEEHSASKVWLTCKPASVVLSGGSRLDVISCTGLPALPAHGETYVAGAVPLAIAPGVFLAIHDYGNGRPDVMLRRGL